MVKHCKMLPINCILVNQPVERLNTYYNISMMKLAVTLTGCHQVYRRGLGTLTSQLCFSFSTWSNLSSVPHQRFSVWGYQHNQVCENNKIQHMIKQFISAWHLQIYAKKNSDWCIISNSDNSVTSDIMSETIDFNGLCHNQKLLIDKIGLNILFIITKLGELVKVRK